MVIALRQNETKQNKWCRREWENGIVPLKNCAVENLFFLILCYTVFEVI